MLIHALREGFLLILDQLEKLRAALVEQTLFSVIITEHIPGEGYFRHLGQQALGRLFRL